MEPILTTHDLSVGYRHAGRPVPILSHLDLRMEPGRMVALLGRNGAGKSTLLRALTGADRGLAGQVQIAGRDLSSLGLRELSRLVGLVSTDRVATGGFTVTELVELGRQPHTGFLGRLSEGDRQAVARAIAMVGMEHKADSYLAQLSDGERQKAMIARAIAQETPLIVLDEPAAFLDVASRLRLGELLHRLSHEQGKAVLLSSHDVQQSLLLADDLWLITDRGDLIAGSTEEVVMSGAMEHMFADPGIAFSPALCDFEAVLPHSATVDLDCHEPLLRHCITAALLRQGIAVSSESRNHFTAHSLHHLTLNGAPCPTLAQAFHQILRGKERNLGMPER